MTEEPNAYNSPDFTLKIPDQTRLGESLRARVGQPAPDFEAPTLEGQQIRLRDLRGKYVVLLMGSITSPMCAIPLPAINQIYSEFKDKGVEFFLLYTKESHPAEHYPHHTSLEQKVSHARDFQRQENIRFPIVVDTLEGTVHLSYGPWPSALFVVHRDGRLIYRSTIANASELRLYLEQLIAADDLTANPNRVPHISYSEYIIEHDPDQATHRRVYERAGPKAFEDFWKIFPNLRSRWP
jgi:peroxiredoxin